MKVYIITPRVLYVCISIWACFRNAYIQQECQFVLLPSAVGDEAFDAGVGDPTQGTEDLIAAPAFGEVLVR